MAETLKAIDLFAGIGGIRLGFEQAFDDLDTIFISEWDKWAAKTYKDNFGEQPEIQGDITQIDEHDIPSFDIALAGFPCFVAGTPVITHRGIVGIEKVVEGDMVLTHKGRFRKVLSTGMTFAKPTVKLFGLGTNGIECTPNHPFLSHAMFAPNTAIKRVEKEAWTPAQDMAGKRWFKVFISSDNEGNIGQWLPCTKIEAGKEKATVFNLEVEEDHSYTVDGIAVHNCQAFSYAGKRQGFEDNYKGRTRGTLFAEVVRICEYHKPKVIFCENVKGLYKHDKGRTFNTITKAFEEIGYKVFSQVLNSKDFGVAQNRERVYIVCFREDIAPDEFVFPTAANSPKILRNILEDEPIPSKYYLSDQYLKSIRAHKARHKAKGHGFGYVIRDLDGISGTVVCGGSGREGNLIIDNRDHSTEPTTNIKGKINDEDIRKLTPREWARLQGFPDSYILKQSDTQLYKQFGNSVTVPVIKAIAEKIKEVLSASESIN